MTNNIKNGMRADTVKNMVFGAGVLYRNFTYGTHYTKTFDTTPKADKTYYQISGGPGGTSYTEFTGESFDATTAYYEKYEGYGGDKIGATKEGTKVTISPEFTDIEVDGVLVKMQGLTRKTGEKATIEAVVVDMDIDNISKAVCGKVNYTDTEEITGASSVNFVSGKSDISEGDYVTNLAVAARRLDNQKMTVVVFKKALCTSGLELDMKNKSVAGNKYTFEAFAEISDTNADTLPVVVLSESN